MPAAATDDREAAFATMRQDLITYWNLPFYRAMIERSGYGDDIAAFDKGQQAGDMEAAVAGISDDFLENLTAIGSADEVRAGVERYAAGRSDLALHRPGARAPTSRRRSKRRARHLAGSAHMMRRSAVRYLQGVLIVWILLAVDRDRHPRGRLHGLFAAGADAPHQRATRAPEPPPRRPAAPSGVVDSSHGNRLARAARSTATAD